MPIINFFTGLEGQGFNRQRAASAACAFLRHEPIGRQAAAHTAGRGAAERSLGGGMDANYSRIACSFGFAAAALLARLRSRAT